jgi:hypothetical protein
MLMIFGSSLLDVHLCCSEAAVDFPAFKTLRNQPDAERRTARTGGQITARHESAAEGALECGG